MSLSIVAADLDKFAKELRAWPEEVAESAGFVIMHEALKRSHGPFSTAYLQRMYDPYGPYSVRDPHPPDNPGIINYQTGLFARSWVQAIVKRPNQILVSTFNVAPYAADLEEGTDRMISRNLTGLVVHTVERLIEGNAEAALPSL